MRNGRVYIDRPAREKAWNDPSGDRPSAYRERDQSLELLVRRLPTRLQKVVRWPSSRDDGLG